MTPKTDAFILAGIEGFSKEYSREKSWKTRKEGLTEHIIQQRSPTIINDIQKCPFISTVKPFLNAGIQSLVAVPFFLDARTEGILYIDDAAPREWSPREIDFLIMLAAQASFTLEKFKLLGAVDETKAYLNNIFDNSTDILVTCDQDVRVVAFNKAAEQVLGYSREEVIGTFAEFIWLRSEEQKDVLKKLKKQGYIVNYETQFKAKDGNVLDISLVLSYVRNRNGEIIGVVGICRDITEQKRLERAIEAHNQQLEELKESLEEKVLERTTELRKANHELTRVNKLKSEFNCRHES